VIPPNALTTPIMAFSRVREWLEAPLDESSEDPPDPGTPVIVVTVVISKAGSMWSAKSEYGEDKSV